MSKEVSFENTILGGEKGSEKAKRGFTTRIPRRTPAFKARPGYRSSAADRPVVDSKLTAPRVELMSRNQKSALAGKGTASSAATAAAIRSRSHDERVRAIHRPRTPETEPARAPRYGSASPQATIRVTRIDRLSANSQKKKWNSMAKLFKSNQAKKINDVTVYDQRTVKVLEAKPKVSTASVDFNFSKSQESVISSGDKVTQLKNSLAEKRIQFNKIKMELKYKQKRILEMYAEMKAAHTRVLTLGGESDLLPSSEELSIMNVAGLEPEQLLKMCIRHDGGEDIGSSLICMSSNLMEKLSNLPTNLVSCCDTTLQKQKDIVDWLTSLLTSKDKGIRMQELINKVNEFTNENMDLTNMFNAVKVEFMNDVSEAVDLLRKGYIDRDILKQRTEQLSSEMVELQKLNDDLHRQVHTAELPKYIRTDKIKIEALEKELKEKKCKNTILRERLLRTDQQVKTSATRVAELEQALQAARGQARALEETVHQLQEKNLKIQMEFDGELNTLTESIKKNARHLEEIAEVREKLEKEKVDLERRLEDTTNEFDIAIATTKTELSTTKARLFETEAQRKEALEKKQEAEKEMENICTNLIECEIQNKELVKKLQEKELELESALEMKNELAMTKRALQMCEMELEDFKQKVREHEDDEAEMERTKTRFQCIEEKLKLELQNKEDCINDLKTKLIEESNNKDYCINKMQNRLAELEEELQDSECKLEKYEHHMQSLKNNLGYLPNDDLASRMDCFTELRHLIVDQRTKLLEATCQNGELAEALQKKDADLEQSENTINSQNSIILRKEELIKMLSDKETEQNKIIDLLQKNLEMRAQVELDINRQMADKTEEIQNLLTNLDMRKKQIRQLEKIILTLEEQQSKSNQIKKKHLEKITMLERMIETQTCKKKLELPGHSIENLISVLEAELGKPGVEDFQDLGYEHFGLINYPKKGSFSPRNNCSFRDRSKLNKRVERDEEFSLSDIYSLVEKTSPTKLLLENFMQKSSYLSNDTERNDSRDLNRYGTNIDNHGWISGRQNNINVYHTLRTDIQLNNGRPKDVACGTVKEASKRVKTLKLFDKNPRPTIYL